LDIPDEGLRIHLRGYGWITVFRFVSTERRTDYIGTNIQTPTKDQIIALVKKRWEIEVFHRELKQTCGLEQCQARTSRAQRKSYCSLCTYLDQTSCLTKAIQYFLLSATVEHHQRCYCSTNET